MTITNTTLLAIRFRIFAFVALILLVSGGFVSYGYFMGQAINLTAQAENAAQMKTEMSGKMAEAETEYIKIFSSLTPFLAKDLGFVDSKDVQYLSRKPLATLKIYE